MPDSTSRKDSRTSRARHLRREATPSERQLWAALRLLELPEGHFRRQTPIGRVFADFAHHRYWLVVELDGDQHGREAGLQRDASRTAALEKSGYRVLRFWNHEVWDNLDGVVETILAHIASQRHPGFPPTPSPSPPQAGGEEMAPERTGCES